MTGPPDQGQLGAASPPIVYSSAWRSAGDPAGQPYAYGRYGNPTWAALEAELGELEGGRALVFGAGMAAVLALVLALTEERTRLIVPTDSYFGVRQLLEKLERRRVETLLVDARDTAAVARELERGDAALWIETPSNPLLRVVDIAALAETAERAGAPVVVDNTLPTSALQRPLDLGATASFVSLTKAASGHSDVVLGAVVTRDEALHRSLLDWRTSAGLIPSPMDAWLARRGLQTLGLRIERQSRSALAVAEVLAAHPRVTAVHYPGLAAESLPFLARQMPNGFGPLLSFEVAGDADAADCVVAAARLVRTATSFGGTESSWERRARWASESAPSTLIRLSIGIEPVDEIVDDLLRALGSP